ncbi:MAG: hypothetical protein Q8Q95_02565, partial [bacterium]|nr:hypothetical protein [bacterium]
LPVRVVVNVENTDEGLWAKISTPDGKLSNCYTQATNATELVVMINDAIFTHFEVPEKFRKNLGFYVPLSNKHLRKEEMFNKLVSMGKQLDAKGGSETTLTLRKEMACL